MRLSALCRQVPLANPHEHGAGTRPFVPVNQAHAIQAIKVQNINIYLNSLDKSNFALTLTGAILLHLGSLLFVFEDKIFF